MLNDINALVQFAQDGSMVRAAACLHRTPSAVTRQIQRLEGELGSKLLDRLVKPPRLTPLGVRVVEQSRKLLRGLDDLRALAAPDSEPRGLLRIGVSHALAGSTLVKPLRNLTTRFPELQLRIVTDLTSILLSKLEGGELDLVVVVLPEALARASTLTTKIVETDRMVIIASTVRDIGGAPTWERLSTHPWVVGPPGCTVRDLLLEHLAQTGAPTTIAAEVHSANLQLAFVEADYGLGFLPKRFVHRHGGRKAIRVINHKSFALRVNTAVITAGELGSLAAAARCLQADLVNAEEAKTIRTRSS
jgi:DNA-binding transcriptional LysR family regulator